MIDLIAQKYVSFKLGKLFLLLLLLLSLTYLFNLFLAYLGFDYSILFQLSYFVQLFLVIFTHVKFNIKINRIYLIFFLFFFSIGILGITVTNLNNLQIPIETPLMFLLTGLLFPIMIANFHLQCLKKDFSRSLNLIFYYVIIKTTLYIILIPLELKSSNSGGFSILQFTGGQYHNIGLILLALTYAYYFGIKKNIILILHILLFITIILSFSRVAILIYLIVILYFSVYVFIKLIAKPSFKKYIFIAGIISILVTISINTINNLYINDFFNYWMVRLNQINNEFDFENIFDQSYVENGRGLLIVLLYQKANFINLIFGYGIGTSQYILSIFTNGELHFGSFHNLIATIIVERGLLFGTVFLFLVLYMFSLFFQKKESILFFILFLFFSLSTGVELFVNSRDLNFDITILFLLFFGAFRCYRFHE